MSANSQCGPSRSNRAVPATREWWHTATIYELYPSSFKDSNSDGVGDIRGIITKVPYLAKLGIDAVWLAACYRSSGIDMGYDVVDYRDIDPQYGTVADVEKLIAELAKHDIKLIMDLVVNHTSDEHAWFRESRSSSSNPKRDWYVWRQGRRVNGKRLPPNNWESIFTGSAWERDDATDEYYLRIFAKQQPDLNWENAELRQAVYEDMRFWLNKGVAGFRMDVINLISKAEGYPDAPVTSTKQYEQFGFGLYCNGPRVHEYLQEMRREVLDHYPGSMSVGEVIITSSPQIVQDFVRPERKELDMAYQYDLFDIDCGTMGKFYPRAWTLGEFKSLVAKWQSALSYSSGHWATVWLESHDTGRSVTRFGDRTEANRFKVAKMLALLETTLGGTLFVYQGQELGMKGLTADIPITHYPDVETQRIWNAMLLERRGRDDQMEDVAEQVRIKARDHARAPLPWTSTAAAPHAGFSDTRGPTWSPMNADSDVCNVARQDADPHSVLNFWRTRIRLRKQHTETLVFGDFAVVESSMDDGPAFMYWRTPPPALRPPADRHVLVLLNLSNADPVHVRLPPLPRPAQQKQLPDATPARYFVLHSTRADEEEEEEEEGGGEASRRIGPVEPGGHVVLGAYDGVVFGY